MKLKTLINHLWNFDMDTEVQIEGSNKLFCFNITGVVLETEDDPTTIPFVRISTDEPFKE